ncbi:Rib7, arfc [Globisporangium polare]
MTTDATTEAETMLHIKQLVHSAMQERVSAITGSHAAIPFVTLTYAQSIDGSIAAVRGSPTLLSGARSMQMTHMLRTMHDAILVGVGTILADNPSLNARFAEGRNPKPVIVDTSLRCPLTIKLFTSSACEKPVILCGDTSASTELQQRRHALEQVGATVIECRTAADASGAPHVDIRHGLERLLQHGVQRVMVEGGAAVLTACLQESARAHLVDSVVVTIAPTFIGGLRAVGSLVTATAVAPTNVISATTGSVESNSSATRPAAGVAPSAAAATFPRLRQPTYHPLGDDLVLVGRL